MTTARISSFVVGLATLASGLGCGSASAEFMECSGSKALKEETSRQVVSAGAGRELGQVVRVWRIASKHPEFDGIDETVFMHLDELNGTGTHVGYWAFDLKSGEKLRAKFEGAHFTVVEAGRWETKFQGVFRFISGTGKFEAIRGGGYYHGVEGTAGTAEQFGCSASY